MSHKEFNFNIDPEELPFWDEDDLGDDEPRIVEYMASKIKEADATFVLNVGRFAKAMKIAKTIINAVNECSSSAKASISYCPIIGKDMFLKVSAPFISFDEDVINLIKSEDDGIVNAVDISALNDETAEIVVSFKDVRYRL